MQTKLQYLSLFLFLHIYIELYSATKIFYKIIIMFYGQISVNNGQYLMKSEILNEFYKSDYWEHLIKQCSITAIKESQAW